MSRNRSAATDDGETDATRNARLLDRRSYLSAAAGAVAAITVGSGLAAADEDAAALDAVDDLGCDPDGNEPVQDAVTDAVADGASVHFPDGQYLIDGEITVEGVDGVELVGADGAEFVVGDFYGYIVDVEGGTGFRLDGMDINQEETNNAGNVNVVADDWEISDVTVYGDEHNPQSGGEGGHKFNVGVDSPDSEGVVRDCQILGYNDLGRYRDVTGGVRAGPEHNGTLYVRNTYVEGRGNNGAYCSRTNGPVIFENCHHHNNNVSQFRIGHPESRVENCEATLDDREIPDWVETEGDANWRGLRAESDERFDHGHAGLQFVDTDVVVDHGEAYPVHSGIQIHERWGGATIDGCHVELNADATAIRMDDVDWDEVSGDDTAVIVRKTQITGDGLDDDAIRVGSGRDGTVFEDCCLPESGVDADSDVSTPDDSTDGDCDS